MKKSLLLAFLALLINMPPAFSQVIDMRAFSRQRGFRAYQPQDLSLQKQSSQRQSGDEDRARSQKKKNASGEKKDHSQKTVEPINQTDEIQQYIGNNPQVIPDI